jgi:tRNA A37 methylthiotransferase MiaB
VLTEVAGLADQGVKEVTLLGQNVNAYRGRDGRHGEIADFALLLEYVAEIPGIERIRYTTSHPNEFTQRLIDAYAKLPQLVNHLHLPVQHGSDRILMAMKRGYTALEYKSTIRKLRAVRPDISLSATSSSASRARPTTTSTRKMMKLIDDVGFDASFSFIFSPAPARRRQPGRRHAARREAQRLQQLQALLEDNVRASATAAWARCSASWSKARRARTRRADGAHRVQPHRQLRMPKGEVVPVPILCTVTFGSPTQIQPGEDKRAFLERTRTEMMALKPGGWRS